MAGAARATPLAVAAVLVLAAAGARGSFFEDFGSGWQSRWTHSTESKYTGRFEVETPDGLEQPALKVPAKAKHYGISAKLDAPLSPKDGLVLQFELKLADGLSCGGAYLKYLTTGEFEVEGLQDDTPYTVMFGPDKCGSTNKVHLIVRHKSPKGVIEEKHLKSPPLILQDKKTHVYTAVLKPDNTYAVLIDGTEKKSGSLFEDFDPSINPPEEIDDPEDKKPGDWVENPKMPDPDATKPDDWDEDAPRQIEDPEDEKPGAWLDDEPGEVDDPEASQPEDWDEEEDGAWEAPRVPNPKCAEAGCGEWKPKSIPNPAYKGKWHPELIDNPEYKGVWAPRKVANPDHYVDEAPLKALGSIGGVAIEIWTMDEAYFFSSIYVGADEAEAAAHREEHWAPKAALEDAAAEEEEAAAKAAADEEEGDGFVERLASRLVELFDAPALAGVKPLAQPLLDKLEERPQTLYLLACGPLALVALLFFCLKPRRASAKAKPSATAVRKAKKEDVTGPDDAVAATAAKAAKQAAETSKKVLPEPEVTEAIAGADEDDEPPAGPRTRARRD